MKKFLISLMLISSVITSLVTVAYADNTIGFTTASALNVRSGASMDSEILGLLPYNTKVTITDTVDNWYAIAYKDAVAYVSRDYVRCDVDELLYQDSLSAGMQVVETAKQYIGTPYVYGGSSPKGFDCSGFTKYIYGLNGVELNRTSYTQVQNGYSVDFENIQPGDLVFFKTNAGISHVGIYTGNNSFIHSPRTGETVTIVTFDQYGKYPCQVQRIF